MKMAEQKTEFLNLEHYEQKRALEALIFSSENVLTLKDLYRLLISEDFDEDAPRLKFDGSVYGPLKDTDEENGENEDALAESTQEEEIPEEIEEILEEDEEPVKLTPKYIEELINEINFDLAESGRPYHIVNVAGGWQFATKPEYGRLAARLSRSKAKRRLSQASLETLAIIAYRQPVSKPEIEKIRGVNSNEIVNSLLEKNLIKPAGRSEGLGKALLYGTTDEFLKSFGLKNLDELPRLKEFEELSSEDPFSEGSIEVQIDEKTGEKIFTFKEISGKKENAVIDLTKSNDSEAEDNKTEEENAEDEYDE